MYNHKEKIIFCHIPKCGGTSVRRSIPIKLIGDPHIPISYDFAQVKDASFSFSFVRNPWDRFVSAYHYLNAGGMGNTQDLMYQKQFFNKFNGCFKSFVRAKEFLKMKHFAPASIYLDQFEKMDFIGKFEDIQNGFNYVCKKLSIPQKEIMHIRKSKHGHYSEYYDNETIETIAGIYKEDIKNFNYKFKDD